MFAASGVSSSEDSLKHFLTVAWTVRGEAWTAVQVGRILPRT